MHRTLAAACYTCFALESGHPPSRNRKSRDTIGSGVPFRCYQSFIYSSGLKKRLSMAVGRPLMKTKNKSNTDVPLPTYLGSHCPKRVVAQELTPLWQHVPKWPCLQKNQVPGSKHHHPERQYHHTDKTAHPTSAHERAK